MYFDLAYGMWATWSVIRFSRVSCANTVAKADQVQNLLFRLHKLLLEPLDLYLLLFILQYLELFVVVKQIVNFAPVYFIHGYGDSEVSLVFLEVSDSPIEEIPDRRLLQPLHRKRLTWACLPICEYSDYALVEHEV